MDHDDPEQGRMIDLSEQSSDSKRNDSLTGERDVLVYTTPTNNDNITHKVKECGCINKWFNSPPWIRLLVVIIIVIIYYILTLIFTVHAYDHQTNITTDQLTARIHPLSGVTKKTCSDYSYGCCNIYENCQIKNEPYHHLDYHKINLDVYRITSHDTLQSNCPSLRTIINRYNQEYGSENCSTFGCCPDFDLISCDDTIHYHINKGNDQNLIYQFRNASNRIPIHVPKIDESGSNCWNNDGFLSGIPHFIDKYEHYYPDLPEPLTWLEIICRILLVCFIVGCILGHL